MHIPLEIIIECHQTYENNIESFLMPNRLIYVRDFYRTPSSRVSSIILTIKGIVFHYEDIQILEKSLSRYGGEIKVTIGKVKVINLTTVLSASIVASIVFVALFAHNFNEQSYKDIFEHPKINEIIKTLTILGGAAAAGFMLEILVIYRDRRLSHD